MSGSLAHGVALLRCFGPGDHRLGNHDLAARTGLSKPTVSRTVKALEQLGLVRHEKDGYALGYGILGLGFAVLGQLDVRRIARPLMQALSENTGTSVNLAVRDRLSMVYVDCYRKAASYTVQLDVGPRAALTTTAIGRACLAALPATVRNDLLDEVRRGEEADWPRIRSGIHNALRDYERNGFCLGLGEGRREVHAIAVPLSLRGEVEPVVFSCSGAAFELTEEILRRDIGPRLLALVGNVRSMLAEGV